MSSPPPSSTTSVRRLALEALGEWEDGSRHAADILEDISRARRLGPLDHAFLQQLLYGVLRHLSRLDGLIDELRSGRVTRETRNVLRLGFFQIFHSHIPAYAAVGETVALARNGRGFVNALLRRADRERGTLEAMMDAWPVSIAQSHPQFLVDRWTAAWGEEAALAQCRWDNEPAPVYARINPLAPEATRAQVMAAHESHKVPGAPGFFQIEGPIPHEWLDSGAIYIQDPSTTLACRMLDAQPGERVLDACAGPGGKTSLLAASLGTGATLVACDRPGGRLRRLRQNLERLHAGDVLIAETDWLAPGPPAWLGDLRWGGGFHAILADVPCSNTGVMRRRVDVRWRIDEREFARLHQLQIDLVERLLPLLRHGGRLIYSTCSIDAEENEAVVAELCRRHPGLRLDHSEAELPWRDGFDGAYAARLIREA